MYDKSKLLFLFYYCFDKNVVPFLVLTKTQNKNDTYDDVQILSPETLAASLLKYKEDTCEIDAIGFLEGEYQPLPTIFSAAIKFFNNGPLPQIRTAKSWKINETWPLCRKRQMRQ